MGPHHTYQHEHRAKRPTRRRSPISHGIYLGLVCLSAGFNNYANVFVRTRPIPRLSKAGMPSRSEGWGGLFKGE